MSAESIEWSESDEADPTFWSAGQTQCSCAVPTTESPHYLLSIRDLSVAGDCFDDIAMLERGALLVARRIDAVARCRSGTGMRSGTGDAQTGAEPASRVARAGQSPSCSMPSPQSVT